MSNRSTSVAVHPLSSDRQNQSSTTNSTNMSGTNHRAFVLYSLVGEEREEIDSRDMNFNAFVLTKRHNNNTVCLEDVQSSFPLGLACHFSFRNDAGIYVDLIDPKSTVPTWENKILARVTPLMEPPLVKISERTVDNSCEEENSMEPEPKRDQFPSFHPNKQTVEPYSQGRHSSRDTSTEDGWRHARSRGKSSDDQYDMISRGDDGNADWLQKQKEQAYDFAKKISMEDAKKNASETAKKAKKWGASLLSSVSASLANAASAVKNETICVGRMNVSIIRPLAEGAYAQVFLVRAAGSGEMLAMKRIICQSQEVENDVQTELRVLQSVKHLNVMPLVEFDESRVQHQEFYFLFPYFERGSLWDSINAARESSSPLWPFNQRVALHIFRGICSGVLELHRAGFCHRDLKPHNVLLTSSVNSGEDPMTYIPVVTDFGSCAPIRVEVRSRKNSVDLQDEANRKSSAPYRAPELFEPQLDAVVDGQSDVWSLGCILYAMAFGSNPFEHPRDGFMKLACINGRVAFPPEQKGVVRHRNAQFNHEFCDFIRDMLHTNPEERPSVLDALEFAEELLSDA